MNGIHQEWNTRGLASSQFSVSYSPFFLFVTVFLSRGKGTEEENFKIESCLLRIVEYVVEHSYTALKKMNIF